MYSKVTYASAWKAMNGFSESMLDELPSRNTPPSLTAPAVLPLPHPAAANAATITTAASPDTRRTRLDVPASFFGRSLMLRHLRSQGHGSTGRADAWTDGGRPPAVKRKVLLISVYRANSPASHHCGPDRHGRTAIGQLPAAST